MAETVVLANLIINTDGTITALDAAGQAYARFERQASQSVDKSEQRARTAFNKVGLSVEKMSHAFFNARQIIHGLFAGFSVGGMVLALGELVRETIASSEAFKMAKETALDFFHALVEGETATDRLIRKQQELAKTLGITTADALEKQMEDARKFIADNEKRLQSQTVSPFSEGAGPGITGFIAGRVLSAFGVGAFEFQPTDAEIEKASKNIAEGKIKLAELGKAYDLLGTRAKKAAVAMREAHDPSFFETAGPETFIQQGKGPMREFGREFDNVSAGINGFMRDMQEGLLTWDQFEEKVNRAIEVLKQYGFTMQDINQIEGVQAVQAHKELMDSIESQIATYEALSAVVGIAGQAVAAAANSGLISAKNAWRLQQALLASEAILRGMIEQAQAIAAAGTPGRQWEVPFHKAAAVLYFAAAAFHGIGAVSGGGGGGGGGGRGERGAPVVATAAPEPIRQGPTIQIYIDGYLSDNGTNDARVGRRLAEIINRAQRDVMTTGKR